MASNIRKRFDDVNFKKEVAADNESDECSKQNEEKYEEQHEGEKDGRN